MKMFEKIKAARIVPAAIGALMDIMKGKPPMEAMRQFLTPDNAVMFSAAIGGLVKSMETHHGCKVAITLRATDDGSSAVIDLLNADTLQPLARYTQNNLNQLVAAHGTK